MSSRPKIPSIKLPTKKFPDPSQWGLSPNARCGDSFPHYIEVGRVELDPIGDISILNTKDLGNYRPDLQRAAAALADSIGYLISIKKDISKSKYNGLKKYYDRANSYITAANKLWKYWEDEYTSGGWPQNIPDGAPINYAEVGGQKYMHRDDIPAKRQDHWSLMQDKPYFGACAKSNAGDFIKLQPQFASGKFSVQCPSKSAYDRHDKDRKVYKDLVIAALKNARCFQEELAREMEGVEDKTPPELILQADKATPLRQALGDRPPTRQALGDRPPTRQALSDRLVTGDAAPIPEGGEKPKKKDNTILIVAGAGLAALLLFRK